MRKLERAASADSEPALCQCCVFKHRYQRREDVTNAPLGFVDDSKLPQLDPADKPQRGTRELERTNESFLYPLEGLLL